MLLLKRMIVLYINVNAGFVQLVESVKARDNGQVVAFNQWVAGSSPARLINKMNELREAQCLPFRLFTLFIHTLNEKSLTVLRCNQGV